MSLQQPLKVFKGHTAEVSQAKDCITNYRGIGVKVFPLFWDEAALAIPQIDILLYNIVSPQVYGVDWSSGRDTDLFLSASWDHTIRLVSFTLYFLLECF